MGTATRGGRLSRNRGVYCHQLEERTLFSVLPTGFAETQIASGILSPTAMTVAPDGRIFIASQSGDVSIVQNGTLLAKPFLSVATSYGDDSQGILGITLDPKFETNGYVYIDYTIGGTTTYQRISRFTANGNVAVPGSEDILFQIGPNDETGHLGGALEFGADGDLYLTSGDNDQADISTLATQLNNFYGKIIRINPDGTIPTDNPFYNQTTGNYRAIWAIGLRNPFKLSVQPNTGLMYIADVGQATYEDIDQAVAGANYGWPSSEGPTGMPGQTAPVYAYTHTGSDTGAYAVIGGPFYDPPVDQFPAQYVGNYFFGDWGSGLIQTFSPADPYSSVQIFATGANGIVALDVGPDGSLYYLTRGDQNYGLDSPNGQLFQVQYTGLQSPSISVQPPNVTAAVGAAAAFSVQTSGTGPFTYQWQQGNTPISGANAATYTLNDVGDSDDGASFNVVVTNSFGMATSDAATLSIIPHAAPTITLTAPVATSSTSYTAGKSIAFSATATDPAFGTLPGSDFAWTVTFYQSTNVSTVWTTSGTSGSYLVPTKAYSDADVYYRVSLTVTDPDGLASTVIQDVVPKTEIVTLASSVPGAQVTLDGAAVATPYSFMSVAGTTHTIAAAAQMIAGTNYNFSSWSDSGTASHTISTPTSTTTYTANFAPVMTAPTLPSPWTQSDIGAVGKPGTGTYNGSAFTVSGAGDIVTAADTFHFVDQALSGNGQIIADVTSQTNTGAWAKGGIMFRESTAAGSKYVALVVTPGHGVELLSRETTGGTPVGIAGISGAAPLWLQLIRAGNVFTAATSSNGVTWKTAGSITLSMNAALDVGLAVGAQTNTSLSTAVFSNVAVTPAAASKQTTLTATADAFVRDGSYANTNFGSSTELDVKTETSGYDRYAFLTFNLSSLTTISAATLELFGEISDSANPSITTTLYAVTGSWSESSVTWNTRPAFSTTPLGTVTVAGTAAKSYQVNLTAWLQQQKAAGKTTVSLMLKNLASTDAYTIFSSRESGANGPQLVVTA